MNLIRILCISGPGRSGSTLLSLLLSQNTDVFNLGQSRDLWKSYNENKECSCGSPLQSCTLWHRVIEAVAPDQSHIMKIHGEMRRFIKHVNSISADDLPGEINYLKAEYRDFLSALSAALEVCREESNASIFVDSSKSPEIALAYILLDNTEVYVLNLVRDPRAIACSWAKKDGNVDRVAKFSRGWKSRQRTLSAWAKLAIINNFSRIRYEDLSRKPRAYVEQILNWIGADTSTHFFTSPNQVSISWERQHLFLPTNEKILRERRAQIDIKEARAWRSAGNWPLHLVVMIHTFPSGILYSLRLDSGDYWS